MAIYSGFTHWKWWFSIVMLGYPIISNRQNTSRKIEIGINSLWFKSKPITLPVLETFLKLLPAVKKGPTTFGKTSAKRRSSLIWGWKTHLPRSWILAAQVQRKRIQIHPIWRRTWGAIFHHFSKRQTADPVSWRIRQGINPVIRNSAHPQTLIHREISSSEAGDWYHLRTGPRAMFTLKPSVAPKWPKCVAKKTHRRSVFAM